MGARREMPGAITLCGSQFCAATLAVTNRYESLGAWHLGRFYQLRRHRLVRASFYLPQQPCRHCGAVVGVYGGHSRCRAASHGGRGTRDAWDHRKIASRAMRIDWMNLSELSEAIPPAYSEYVARHAPA
jgi:hypothetical protein